MLKYPYINNLFKKPIYKLFVIEYTVNKEVENINIIRVKRVKKGWTQLELAEVSGVPQCTISQIERGSRRYPTYDTIRKIAKALDLPLEDFSFIKDHNEKGAVKDEDSEATSLL